LAGKILLNLKSRHFLTGSYIHPETIGSRKIILWIKLLSNYTNTGCCHFEESKPGAKRRVLNQNDILNASN